MKITISQDFDTIEEAVAFFQKVTGDELPVVIDAPAVEEIEAPPRISRGAPAGKPKGKVGRPKGSTKTKAATAVASVQVPETKLVPPKPIEVSEPAVVPNVNVARAKLQELNAKKGMAVCQRVMADLKMPRVSDLKPEQIAPFIAAVQQEIERE